MHCTCSGLDKYAYVAWLEAQLLMGALVLQHGALLIIVKLDYLQHLRQIDPGARQPEQLSAGRGSVTC